MKILVKIASFFISPLAFGFYITLAFVGLSVQFYEQREDIVSDEEPRLVKLVNFFHQSSIDARLWVRGEVKRPSKVAILAVDEEALEQLGHWPWPRNVIGETAGKLLSYDAKLLAFDMVFSEEDKKSAIPSLLRVRKLASTGEELSPQIEKILQDEIHRSNTDEQFAQIVAKQSKKLVMGAYYEPPQISGEPYQDLCYHQIFNESKAFSYWMKEEPLITSTDDHETALFGAWSVLLEEHFGRLESEAVAEWLKSRASVKEKLPALKSLFAKRKLALSEAARSVVLQHWIKSALQDLKPRLSRLNSDFESAGQIETLSESLDQLFEKDEKIRLSSLVAKNKENYCGRFLTRTDELKPAFEKVWADVQKEDPTYAKMTFSEGIEHFKNENLKNPVQRTNRWTLNIPSVAEGTSLTGTFNAVQDSDGTIRSNALVARSGSLFMGSLGFTSFLKGEGLNASIEFKPDEFNFPPKYKRVSYIDLRKNDGGTSAGKVPVDHSGKLMINYAGGKHMFPYMSVAQLLNRDTQAKIYEREFDATTKTWQTAEKLVDKAEFIRDRYFIMGATAIGLYDLRVTPFEENYPGVETHANVLDNLLRRDYLTINGDEALYAPLFMLGLGILLSFFIAKFGALTGLIATLTSLVGTFFADMEIYFRTGQVNAIVFPMGMTATLYAALTFYKYLTEERQKKELRGTFSKYVSPQIVNELLRDPSNLELGGRKQHMTAFFSDVRGFTTISEKLDPRALSDVLNLYLTPMTELVFKNKGTLDKYMGDAIMAFFGAPVAYPDHALMACRCALDHMAELKKIQKKFESEGLPHIDIGIGINTGDMSVGNMGSKTVRSYTVMGDAVNLASRLEGITKQYGVRIVISEFTQAEVKEKMITRELDLVRVKGKLEPVKIFELVAEKDIPTETAQMLALYEQGYARYHQKDFSEALDLFSRALTHVPDDAVCALYSERCQEFLVSPPPQNWDGVFNMKTK